MINQVKEFMEAFGQLPNKQSYINLLNLRFRLIDEEVQELQEAETPVVHLDAIVDILYVAYGALLALNEDEMTDEYETIPYNFEELKAMKPAVTSDGLAIAEDYDRYVEEIHEIIHRTRILGSMFPIEEAFDEVHNSNMSKLDGNGKPIKNQYGKVLKGPHYLAPNLGLYIPEETDETNTND